ncbi:MAG: nucleotidyltransferase domain-containing protein [Alphaproteobacteria bacterium]|nr:nucleotidyltransferase domain-containing protein [Alphaproteobacteria bacterium]
MFRRKFQYHKTLAPYIWDNSAEINQLVSQSLQMMVAEYIRYLGNVIGLPISSEDIVDIFIHGSIANYYWDKHSDIDLCIVADLSKLNKTLPNLDKLLFFRNMYWGWRSSFGVSLFGHNVDIFILDTTEVQSVFTNTVDTFFSLFSNKWAIPPKRVPDEELNALQKTTYKKYRVIKRQCKHILKQKMTYDFIDAYLVALKRHRRKNSTSSYNYMITSTQMAFKMARNSGMFSKLQKASRRQKSKRYTME